MENIISWIVETVGAWGYPGIIVMMTLESSFFPFPSEVAMIPAGYLSHRGDMNAFLAIASGIFGSWLGALVNYYLAVCLGRPFLHKYGKYFLLNEKNLNKVEEFWRRHGEIGTFTGRLIPVVRQYISFPAGLSRMNMGRFLFYTTMGAGLWVCVLVYIGYVAGQNEELIKRYSREATIGALVSCVILIGVYSWYQRRKATKRALTAADPNSDPK